MAAVLTAAQESTHVFPLAALPLFAENSHLGHRTSRTTFRPGTLLAISNTAAAMPIFSYESAPGFVVVANNPLSYTDPSGMFIEAAGPGSAFGPAGTIIGGLIDLGEVFGALFGLFGGGSGPPALANVSFPNQFPSAGPSGGPLGPGNGDQWSEQAPFGGPVGTGGLFGSGNTSPFVFSYTSTQTMPWPTTWPQIPGWTGLWPALGSGARVAANVGARALGLGLALILNPVPAGGKDEIAFEHSLKQDIQQVRQAAKVVSRQPGCRAPEPSDFESVHEIIKDQKGPNGKVTWQQLLDAWREVLCGKQ